MEAEVKVEIKKVLVKDLKYAPYNPRKISDEMLNKLKQSIEEFGYVEPIVVNKRTRHVVGGNQRLKALEDLGIEEVEAVFVDLDDAREKALNVALNKITGEWDYPKLKDLLEELDTGEIDIELTGFDMVEIEDLMTQFHVPEEIIEDEVPEPPKEAITKPGNLWILGRHRLLCGDATKKEDVERLMNGVIANICFTSPPYNAGKSESLSGNTHMKDNKYINYKDENNNYLQLLTGFTKIVLAFSEYAFVNIQQLAGNKLDVIDYLYNFKNNFVDAVIWKKTNTAPAMSKNVLNSQFEYIYIFKNETNPSRAINTANFRGTISNVYEGPPQRQNEFSEIHAATFPMHLPTHFIKSFTQINGIVLDCFGGTGTTLIAAEQLNRTCYMMEIDPVYCDVIIRRWEAFTGQKAVKVNG